jgi:C1A family cysteine protease
VNRPKLLTQVLRATLATDHLIHKYTQQEKSMNQGEDITPRAVHGKGWRPDLPDHRDLYYHAVGHFFRESAKPRPPLVDLRHSGHIPVIEDQGQLGSCTAFGTLAAFNYLNHLEFGEFTEPSHLFQYYNARLLEGTTSEDSGATIRDAVKAAVKFGEVPEATLPYNVAHYRSKPAQALYDNAQKHKVTQYLRVENDSRHGGLTHLTTCLAAGHPVIFGATLYESFENPGPDANAVIHMPPPGEGVLGGHCQLIVGYDMHRRLFLVRNSWGTGWADNGYEWMPFDYLLNTDLATDFWTLRQLASPLS